MFSVLLELLPILFVIYLFAIAMGMGVMLLLIKLEPAIDRLLDRWMKNRWL